MATVRALRILIALLVLTTVLGLEEVAADCPSPPIPTQHWYLHHLGASDGSGSYLDNQTPQAAEKDSADASALCQTCAFVGNGGSGPGPLTITSSASAGLPEPYYLNRDRGFAHVWITGPSNSSGPAPDSVVRVLVYADDKLIASGENIIQAPPTSPPYDTQITVNLATPATPLTPLSAGAKIKMQVELMQGDAPTDNGGPGQNSGCGCYNPQTVPLGSSPGHPWSFSLPYGPLMPPTIRLRPEPELIPVAPGADGRGAVNITNYGPLSGGCQYDVKLDVDAGGLTLTWPDTQERLVYEAQFGSLSFTFKLPATATAGTNYTIKVKATAGGAATFSPVPIDPINITVATMLPANATTTPKKHGAPDLTAPIVLVALLAVVARRRT